MEKYIKREKGKGMKDIQTKKNKGKKKYNTISYVLKGNMIKIITVINKKNIDHKYKRKKL